ncbi:TetR/AcrR family transcriptional regulator [Brevibacillus laterosporus]|uniref:TetR/AcrR family transcriptional regulator n=1 Tax=Brevibacillus laterosporus TaxID=1465 RepID=A0AAP3GD68_BRELA|nr:TetR/AcrR family transcriptional regulator [Brevibacillus laterosporus]MCR8980174.1 TetR/AcrR family transcriptional regulator [Brevibacillus laterosporus]MCZ0807329.1 TetR/AcrR family transcriptional regulator [Brevibacillus laterosporus]MCZ0825562.1 TetR/AcrR family transcriptional regulator [Brevibacillus laterosporus]MCZ0849339.1 TetR/AcrR family transcriptional regulator [Brevibacillus laterosporus]PPB10751.1 TetR/AcrR family transcriptional regulator [Brevibacillus laterosporus]
MQERIAMCVKEEIKQYGIKFTMANVAQLAGISTKTLYGIFVSKEELLAYIIQQDMQHYFDKETEILQNKHLGPIEKLKQLFLVIPSELITFDLRFLAELKRFYPDQWQIFNTLMHEGWDNISRFMEEGIAEGIFRPVNVKVFIQMFIGSLQQMTYQSPLTQQQMTVQEALEAIMDIMVEGVRNKDSEPENREERAK